MVRRITAYILTLCLLAATLLPAFGVWAATVTTGTVHVEDLLRVREGPGADYAKIGELLDGDVVTIHDTVTAKDKSKWYKVTKGELTGYASADYITVNIIYEYETDEEFEEHLTKQKFPEDYKVLLRQLHAKYPKWIFLADHLSMTWEEALTAESKVGLNTISTHNAWKSMEYGAYNWDTGKYVVWDSGGWVSAAPTLIAHYMDPRNFLNETYIFQFEDLTYSANQTAKGVKAILPEALDKHAEDVVKAAAETGVSAYFLATRMTQEGTHLNGLGTGTVKGYEGYYNFFDYGAWAHSGNSAVVNGAIYAKNKGWDTPYKCLVDSAELIGKNYIKLGQDTLFYQKYNLVNTKSGLYTHQYMSNTAAAASEGKIRFQAAAEKELKNALTFSLPVYKDMPAEAAPQPSKEGDNNNFLDSITVSDCELTPTFDRYTMEYAAQVPGEVTEVEITAIPNGKGVTVTGISKETVTVQATETTTEKSTKKTTTEKTSSETETDKPTDEETSKDKKTTEDEKTTTTKKTTTKKTTKKTTKATEETTTTTHVDKEITVDGKGKVPLSPGDNEILITVTATSGQTRTYTLIITRNAPIENMPQITGKTYAVKDTVTKVEPNTEVNTFIKNLAVADGEAKVYTADGKQKTKGTVATGDIVRLYSGKTLCISYPVVIYGDVNGDGKISSLDLRIIQKHILGVAKLKGYALTAADARKDGAVASLDLRVIQKYILGVTKTLQ